MANAMKECRCGARIPDTWPNCAACDSFAGRDAQDGGFELRMERYWGARAAWEHNQGVEPHISPDLLALIAGEISKRAQEASILGLRQVSRLLSHANLQVKFHNMRLEEPHE